MSSKWCLDLDEGDRADLDCVMRICSEYRGNLARAENGLDPVTFGDGETEPLYTVPIPGREYEVEIHAIEGERQHSTEPALRARSIDDLRAGWPSSLYPAETQAINSERPGAAGRVNVMIAQAKVELTEPYLPVDPELMTAIAEPHIRPKLRG